MIQFFTAIAAASQGAPTEAPFPDDEPLEGSASGIFTRATIGYSSTIDAITDLQVRYSFDTGFTANLPIFILMHGFGGDLTTVPDSVLDRYASIGMFACAVGMRGRDGAGGAKDAGGRENYDIYDGGQHIRNTFAITSNTKTGISGVSGGGANVLSCASKFPDEFIIYADYFGMSDYGEGPEGWWNDVGDTSTLESQIGDSPTGNINLYKARNSLNALFNNLKGGFLYTFHDPADVDVPVHHTENVTTAMGARLNYAEDIKSLYTHGNFNNSSKFTSTEAIFLPQMFTDNSWRFPASGTVDVIGWVKTRRFEIRLGTLDNEFATVVFNVNNDSYTVTPHTGTMTVDIVQGSKTANQVISTTTVIIVT